MYLLPPKQLAQVLENMYSKTCYEQPPLRDTKSGLLTQVAAHTRVICTQNSNLENDQVASHWRSTADKWLLIADFTVL